MGNKGRKERSAMEPLDRRDEHGPTRHGSESNLEERGETAATHRRESPSVAAIRVFRREFEKRLAEAS